MKLFFRALTLAVLGIGAIGGGILFAGSNTTSDPQALAIQVVLTLAGFAFGIYALLQAKEDYSGYKKANKYPNKWLNAAFIVLAVLGLAFAGYKAWQSTQPIDVTITYLNGTTGQPLANARLYLATFEWTNSNQPKDSKQITTNSNGQTVVQIPRQSSYGIYEKPLGLTGNPQGELDQINPYGLDGTHLDMTVYSGRSSQNIGVPHDTYTVQAIDSDNQPIANASVRFYTSSGTATTLATDANGQAQIQDNAYGPISVFIAKPGFQSQVQKADSGVITLILLTPSP